MHKTADGKLPFEVFLENSNFRWAEFRSQYGRGAIPDRKRNLDFKQFIAKGADPNTRLNSGETLLNDALNRGILQYGHDKELALILCSSANINNPGLRGDYPLHCFLRNLRDDDSRYSIDIVKDFLRRGANPNETNQAGESPLLAFLGNECLLTRTDIAGVLMQSGANPVQRNAKGELPIYLAVRKFKNLGGLRKWLKLLLEAKQPDGVTQLAVRLGEAYDDQDWWVAYYSLYQACSWSSPAYLAAFSHRLPADTSELISETALSLIAEKFLSSTKACFATLKETQGLQSHDTRNICDQIVAILRDCRALEIDVDQKWYHLLLEMFD